MTKYAKARRDFEALEKIDNLDDWVSLMDNLTDLMQNPTKAHAAGFYESGIRLWFQQHKAIGDTESLNHPVARRIAAKGYGQ